MGVGCGDGSHATLRRSVSDSEIGHKRRPAPPGELHDPMVCGFALPERGVLMHECGSNDRDSADFNLQEALLHRLNDSL